MHGNLLSLQCKCGHALASFLCAPLERERSESKWLRHSIQFRLGFYLICSSLCRRWKGILNLESKFLNKRRFLSGRQAVCLSSTPDLGTMQCQDLVQGQLSMFTRPIGILQNKKDSKVKDNSRDSKMKLACHAEQGNNRPLQFCQKLETDFR